MKNFFLISTGGSGGHVIPAMILHDHLSEKADLIVSTDKRGKKYIDKKIQSIEIVNTPKLNSFLLFPINFVIVLLLIIKSLYILKKWRVEKIFSTGGYMSFPLILAGKILNLKIYLLEPNHVLGRANKFFLKSCKKIFCYTNEIKKFPNNFKNKITIINPLVRKNIYNQVPKFRNNSKFNIIIVGGSQGAKVFDNKLKDIIVKISKKNSLRVFHQTNEKNISFLSEFYKKNDIENTIFSYDKNFINIINKADLCITRAGASTLAELSVLNIPFIAVPLPTSKDNHQFENAKFYQKNNCCWMVEQDLFEEKIEKILKDVIEEKTDYLKKKTNLKKLNFQNTWLNVNQKILRTLDEN